MRAGSLRNRLVVQTKVAGTGDGMGGFTEGYWEDTQEVFGAIWPLRGEEAERMQQINPEASLQIRVRYVSDLTPANRLRLSDTTTYFDIVHIADRDYKHRELTLICREDV